MFARQWRYRGRCDSIQFCVDKRIFIVGFGLYGSSNGAADYSVRIELKRLGRVLAGNNKKFFSDGSSNTFQVHFEQPVQVCVTPCSLFFFLVLPLPKSRSFILILPTHATDRTGDLLHGVGHLGRIGAELLRPGGLILFLIFLIILRPL